MTSQRRSGAVRIAPVLLVSLALIAIVVGWAADREPAGPRSGSAFHGAVTRVGGERPAAVTRLRVGTFNLHGGEDREGNASLDRAAQTLQGLDFVGLQEVRGATQVEGLAGRLGLAWCFAPSERRFFRDHFGNAALSARPAGAWRSEPLQGSRGKGFRCYLTAELDLGGVGLTVIVTHLDRHQDRLPQLATVSRLFLRAPAPALLMGDLNTEGDEPALRSLLEEPGVVNAVSTNPALEPVRRLDWILARGLRVLAAGEIDHGASDHPCLWADVELPDASD